MSTYKTEEEQVDDLKRWIKSYAPSIIVGVLLALGIIYGRKYWNQYKTSKAQAASALYETMTGAYEQKQMDVVNKTAAAIKDNYASSPYAEYASLLQAKAASDQQDYQAATTALNWAVKHATDDNLKAIANIRLAKIQVANKQAKQALTTLASIENKKFVGLADVVKGEAYMALGQKQQAKQAYLNAQKNIPNADQLMPTLQIRIDNIA